MRFFARLLIAACLLAGFALVQASPVFAQTPPGFTKAFSPARIALGEISRLTYTIDNSANAVAVTGLAFTNFFPFGLIVANPSNVSVSCGGGPFVGSRNEFSRGMVSMGGGTVAARQTCTLAVDVQALRAGTLETDRAILTSDLLVSTPGATATLMVDEAPLSVSMAFGPSAIDLGGVSRLTHTLDNGASVEATLVALSDRLPPGVVVADPPDAQTTCAGGGLTAAAGTREIVYSNGALAAGASCTIAVDVTSATAGSYSNETESVTSSLGTSTAAEATLTVTGAPLGFSKAFSPARVAPGEISRLTFTIDNAANPIEVGSLAFTDFFPEGLIVADPPNVVLSGCVAFVQSRNEFGKGRVSMAGGTVAARQTCTIAVDVQARRAGTLENRSRNLTSDLLVSTPGARATLRVDEAPLSVSMAFGPPAIDLGGVSRLTHTLDNGASVEATLVALSDRLPPGVVLANPPDAQTTCAGGGLTAAAGTREIAYSNGALAAGASCTIAVDVTSATAGSYSNETESVTSSLGTSTAAEATLRVDPAEAPEAPGFTKRFFPRTIVAPGRISTLIFTIDNTANAIAVGSLAFTDDFPDGMVVSSFPRAQSFCGGTFSPVAGATTLTFSGGRVAAGATCTIAVNVRALRAGTLENRSGALASDLPVTTSGARATLRVDETPLTVLMAFSPPTIDQGGVSRLTYTLDSGATIGATSVALSDRLPAGVALADPPAAQTTCSGGRLTAVAGSREIAYSDGALATFASCTIAVDVTSATAGSYPNETESVTSSLGTSTAAEATLRVVGAAMAPGFARVFAPDRVAQGGETQIVFTLDNTANAVDLGELAFTDAFPDGLVVADAPSAENGCGGSFDPVAGAATLAFADGALAAGATCEIRVTLRAIGAGRLTVPAVTLRSNVAPATAAEATLTVDPAEAPGFAKAFSPARVAPGGISRLTYTIDNSANAIEVTGLAFADTFPDGLIVADPSNVAVSCGGGPSVQSRNEFDRGRVSLSGGTLAARQTCTLSVDVQALRAGTLANLSGALASDLPVSTPGVTATLTVDEAPLSVSMAFSPPAIAQGGVSRLTYTLDNGAAIGAIGVALSDRLPAAVTLADPPDAQTTCTGGRLTAAAGDEAIAYSEGALAAGASCTIAVDVTSAAAGSHANETESVTSSLGTSTPAEATLTVTVTEPPLSVSMAFSPRAIAQGGVSRLTHTLRNDAAIGATSVALSDRLPPGVTLADPPDAQTTCSGGRLTAAAGTRTIAYSEGALAAGASCTIAVDVTPATAARYPNETESVTSSLGTSAAVSARLTVDAVDAPRFARVFAPDSVRQGGETQIVFTLDNGAVDLRELAFTDAFPDGLVVADAPSAENGCGGRFDPVAGAATLAFADARWPRVPPASSG